MGASALIGGAVSDAERATVVSIVAAKMREACFVDWVVGVALLAFYGYKLYSGAALASSDLWPLIAALGITRFGNTIVKVGSDFSYWRWHRPGERDNA